MTSVKILLLTVAVVVVSEVSAFTSQTEATVTEGTVSFGTNQPTSSLSSSVVTTSMMTSMPTTLVPTTIYMNPPGFMFPVRPPPNTTLPVTVAIICGCLIIALTAILFTIIGLVLRFVRVKDGASRSTTTTKRTTSEAFYAGLNPMSHQQLVGSMSSESFGSSPSMVHMNAREGGNVHHNKGFEVDQSVEGGGHVHYQKEGASRQIERSKKNSSRA